MISAYNYYKNEYLVISDQDEENFFSNIRNSNLTFKSTVKGRLNDLNDLIVQTAPNTSNQSLSLLDVGVSSGITSYDLMECFLNKNKNIKITATDISFKCSFYALPLGVKVLVDSTNQPLQFDFMNIGIRAWNKKMDYFTGYFLLTKIFHYCYKVFRSKFLCHVALISKSLDKHVNRIELIEDNFLKFNPSFSREFDIIRAANTINLSYFDTESIIACVDNLIQYARGPGSLIIICRTHDGGENHGTVFEVMSDNMLKVRERIGRGSEVEQLISDRIF